MCDAEAAEPEAEPVVDPGEVLVGFGDVALGVVAGVVTGTLVVAVVVVEAVVVEPVLDEPDGAELVAEVEPVEEEGPQLAGPPPETVKGAVFWPVPVESLIKNSRLVPAGSVTSQLTELLVRGVGTPKTIT